MDAHVSTQPATPPTHPGVLGTSKKPPAWPTVLGTIAIVLGALGIVGGVWGVAAQRLAGTFVGTNPQLQTTMVGPVTVVNQAPSSQMASAQVFRQPEPWVTTGTVLATMVLGVVLLVCGVGLLRRRRWAMPTSIVWAILKILVVCVSVSAMWLMQQAQFRGPNQQSLPLFRGGFVTIFSVVAVGVSMLWGCALPVFVLVWFSRAKTKAEVAAW